MVLVTPCAVSPGVVGVYAGDLDRCFDVGFFRVFGIVVNGAGKFVEIAAGAADQVADAEGHTRMLGVDLIDFGTGGADKE